MMRATQRHRKLVADLAPERAPLRKAQMVRIRRPATANKTGLFDHVPDMVAVTNAARFRESEDALVDLRYPGLFGYALISGLSWMD